MRVRLALLIISCLLIPTIECWADFEVLDISLAGVIQDRQPIDPVSPPAFCEKDKNGKGELPVIDTAVHPKIFFWMRIASSSAGTIRHTWLQHVDNTWVQISQVNLSIRPSSGYRMWSSKDFRRGDPIGDWMIVVASSADPDQILCITRFSVK
ncbi:MAG: DUF2914 domain-containing protein [Nitrospirales bacterium]|nr:DUF2914 domain-containing protein [Nitrospira sp.]MDR4501390.1 DUF2914 domain-containing protein [Nitrospirales bacterium]